jgi:hypothetical protein
MPVPGPRDQFRDHTVRNPDHENMRFFEYTPYHGIVDVGQSPGTMERTLRGCVLAFGQVRHLWKQAINYSAAQSPVDWTDNLPQPGQPQFVSPRGFQLTRALRYLTRSLYIQGGTDNTRYSELHTQIISKTYHKPITTGAGQKRTAPTVRNRLTSFGSRVTPLNQRVQGAEEN